MTNFSPTDSSSNTNASEGNNAIENLSSKPTTKSLIDMDIENLDVPREVKDILNNTKTQVINLQRKNKTLRMRLYRWKKGVKTGNSLLSHLKYQKYINENVINSLKESLPSHAFYIFRRLLRKPNTKAPFPPALQSFATTLHFYSPKAYDYVRNDFMKCLPHPNSISRWYRNVNCSFGISDACIEAVNRKVNSQKSVNEKADILCNLVFDEMKIKKNVDVINGKEYGYVDIGKGVEDDNMPLAENALVVMLVCINGSWKIPVSHYFINSLSGKEKATIIKEILLKLNETGVTITSITFDGLQSNITMCTELGVTISAENHENAYFLHPVSKKPVFIMPDGCHALKLIRNAFANDVIYDGDGNVISWNFLEKLVDVQELEGLRLGTKIRRDHIQFEQNKMNVHLAAQTLSESCSSALRYMKNSMQNPEFDNVDGTANFCSIINEGFDILNSRELYNNKCKNSIDEKNIEEIKKKVDKIITYIKGLRSANGTPVVNYPRKTGFVGMIISLQNIVKIYDSFIKPINGYLLTYKLSQDHLENFFSAVRSKGGYSNNPTCYQFIHILKKLLVHADVKESKYANSTSLDTTNILKISLKKDPSEEISTNSIVNSATFFQTVNYISENDDFYGKGKNKKYIDNVVSYIAGFIIRTILKKSRCYVKKSRCSLLLTPETNNSSLTETKNRGGLLSASSDVTDICKLVEKNFRLFYTSRKGIFNKLFRSILNNIPDNLLPIEHSEDPIKHRLFLLNQIIFTYL